MDWISTSEVECLDEVIAAYGSLSFTKLTELSHDEAWRGAERNRAISEEAIVHTVGNPNGLLAHLNDPNP